jgi:alpha-glucosidase (family GH31 glycosyl hydrolase)
MGHMQLKRTSEIMLDSSTSPTPDERPFILSSSTFAGSGAYGQHYSLATKNQTWEYMRYSIASLLNFNMFGIPMSTSPLCGKTDGSNYTKFDEVCGRWF